MAANATAVLEGLGLDLGSHGLPTSALRVESASGAVLQAADIDALPERYARGLSIHRADLHGVLLRGVEGTPLRMGITVTGLSQDEAGVDVTFSDGTEERFDLVIGADGIHSSIRHILFGDAGPKLIYSGYTCWRFVCPNPGVDAPTEIWGRGRRAGLIPLTEGRMYAFLVANAPKGAKGPSSFDTFRDAFAELPEIVHQALDSAESTAAQMLHHDLYDLERPVWGRDRVWLLGDAAHALLPNLGQGAAMAMEDAASLPLALQNDVDPQEGFRSYVASRHDRVHRVWRDSRVVGRVGQWESGIACWLRDGLVRMTPSTVARRRLETLLDPGIGLARSVTNLVKSSPEL